MRAKDLIEMLLEAGPSVASSKAKELLIFFFMHGLPPDGKIVASDDWHSACEQFTRYLDDTFEHVLGKDKFSKYPEEAVQVLIKKGLVVVGRHKGDLFMLSDIDRPALPRKAIENLKRFAKMEPNSPIELNGEDHSVSEVLPGFESDQRELAPGRYSDFGLASWKRDPKIVDTVKALMVLKHTEENAIKAAELAYEQLGKGATVEELTARAASFFKK